HFPIRGIFQSEHGDGFRLRIDNPVFRNLGFRIISPFVNQIAFRLFGADDFQSQVGAGPEAVLSAWVAPREEQQEIGLAELAWPDAKTQRREPHLATPGLKESDKGQKQKLQYALMTVRWHRQYFQKAIGEFNQPA